MREFTANYVTNNSGATAIEYGLIASGIALNADLDHSSDWDQRRRRL